MYKKLIFMFILISSVSTLNAAELTVSGAKVTSLQVYETADDTTKVWIHLNGKKRVGPNPKNPSNTCELWTLTDSVYSAALSAMMSGNKIVVTYVDQGQGNYY